MAKTVLEELKETYPELQYVHGRFYKDPRSEEEVTHHEGQPIDADYCITLHACKHAMLSGSSVNAEEWISRHGGFEQAFKNA